MKNTIDSVREGLNTMDYTIDPVRETLNTGIFVRAKLDGKIGTFDISMLDLDSINGWLRSRGGGNEWAEAVVRLLLHYQ